MAVFLIRKPFPCQSVADPVRSVNVFMDIFCRGSVKDVRDATRTSRMGIRTTGTVTEELRMRYRRAMDIIHGESHKDITDGGMGGKDYP